MCPPHVPSACASAARSSQASDTIGAASLSSHTAGPLFRPCAQGDVNLVSLSCGETYVQASGDENRTYILDVRRPDVPLHVLEHDVPHETGYVNGVSAVWYHHSHATLVTGSDDNTVRIWDVGRASPEVSRLVGHTSPVSCVAVSPDDDLIASGCDGGKVVLYSRRTTVGSAAYRVGCENDIVLMRQAFQDSKAFQDGA
jgi:FOG: WD40 repeat